MKLLTLNTHSLASGNAEYCIDRLSSFILSELPDVIALQEVNQSIGAPRAKNDINELPDKDIYFAPMKEDNFALSVMSRLSLGGADYHLLWLPVKHGYSRFDEGLALITRNKAENVRGVCISQSRSTEDWRTRMALVAHIPALDVSVCNLHTGRADDKKDPFSEQWRNLRLHMTQYKHPFIMGDFNIPSESDEYHDILSDDFLDLRTLSKEPVGDATAESGIDGWSDGNRSMRIDYIFSGFVPKCREIKYRTVFNGIDGDVISDHFGVLAELV